RRDLLLRRHPAILPRRRRRVRDGDPFPGAPPPARRRARADQLRSGRTRVIGTVLALTAAAILEVWGDHLILRGLPHDATRLLLGALVLAAYGFAVNLWWRGDFSKLLGIYVVFFFVVSQFWGMAFEGERLDTPRIVGGAFIVLGGAVVQWWRPG